MASDYCMKIMDGLTSPNHLKKLSARMYAVGIMDHLGGCQRDINEYVTIHILPQLSLGTEDISSVRSATL